MTTLILTNDWHFAVKNPVSRVDDYNAELLTLLGQILKLAVHVRASGIVVAGDLFHDSKSRYPTPLLVQLIRWLVECRRAGVKVFVVPGNHDLTHDRYESLDQQPLGLLIESGLVVNCARTLVWANDKTLGIVGVPWPDGSTLDAFTSISGSAQLVVAHGFATPEGGEKYGVPCHKYDQLAVAAPHVKVWHFGHDHTDHGVYTLKNNAKVVNLGALCRGALDTDNITRQVKVAIASFPDGPGDATVQQVALKMAPASEIFDLQLRERRVKERQHIAQFVQQLANGLLLVPETDVKALLDGLVAEAGVRARVVAYLDTAEQTV